MTSSTISLPLFPLDLVLFPGGDLPLHVFEERYKRMMNLCLREDCDFGVVLARAATDIPGQAITYEVGTTAHIHGATRLPDGRMNLVTLGVRRFQIVDMNWDLEYCMGEVRWLPEDDGGDRALLRRAARQWDAFRAQISALTHESLDDANLPDDASDAAYLLASTLPVSNEEKQLLLEATNTDSRLREVTRLLTREHGLLKFLAEERPTVVPLLDDAEIFPN